jgi:hypothetical protein
MNVDLVLVGLGSRLELHLFNFQFDVGIEDLEVEETDKQTTTNDVTLSSKGRTQDTNEAYERTEGGSKRRRQTTVTGKRFLRRKSPKLML